MGKSNTSSWVPQQVADFVATALLEPHDQASLDRLRRLMTSPDMQPAWKTLAGETTDSDLLIAFTRQAAFSLWLSWGAQLLPLSSPTQARQQARKVVQASQALLKHLEALGEGHAERGAQWLAGGVYRASLDAAAKKQYGQLRKTASLAHRSFGRQAADAVNQLRWLHEAARVATDAPSPSGPTKLRAKNAVRTAYVAELASVIKQHFKKPLFAVVATTTNVMFDEFESPLTAEHVRKLIHPPQKIPRKKRQ